MSNLPDATITIQDGRLGQVPASVANASVKIGVCSLGVVGTLYPLSSIGATQATIGQGPLAEAVADTLSVAGGPVYALPANPSTAGTSGSVTHTGTGTATVTPSSGPAQTIDVKISTSGALATMQFQYRINGGAYSAPVATAAGPFVFPVPGTLTTLTFASQTYTSGDVWTVATSGAITLVGVGTVTWLTQVSSPLDGYDVLVTIAVAGAPGTGVFTYSMDGGNNTSTSIAIPGAGVYVIPNTGVVLTFSGTFVANDTYRFSTTTASFSTSDVTTAFTTLLASPVEWGFAHVVGMASNAAGAASMATVVDGKMAAAEVAFRYVFTAVECPTVEADSALISAFSNFTSLRTMVCAGDIGHTSQVNGRVIRRNCATVVTSRLANISPGVDAAKVADGAVKNVRSLYRDEAKTEVLDAQRFTTMRTFVGRSGYFITNARMMAPGGSDFTYAVARRVMDVACRAGRARIINFVNTDLLTDPKTGKIFEPEALRIEASVKQAISEAVVTTRDASAVTVVFDRSENILSTNHFSVDIGVQPKGYARKITATIGFSNPALG